MTFKYVLTEYNSFAIFSDTHVHADMARGMHGKPVSAGFCHLSVDYNDGNPEIKYRVNCHGRNE